MVDRQSHYEYQQRGDQIRSCKPVETRTTTDDGNNLCVIRHSGSEKYHGDENQNGHKSQNQIQNPERIKIQKEITNCKSVALNPGCFGLHIHNHNDDRQKCQHKNEGSQIFFDDVKVYDFHRTIIDK